MSTQSPIIVIRAEHLILISMINVKRTRFNVVHTHTDRQTDVENCFANLVPKTKLSVFVFSTIFLVWPELILDKKRNFDSCCLGKFLLVCIVCLNCMVELFGLNC